ncbi:predicted protein [Streptomyces sp. SPB78]|nr:predicted protein [Streptomyces sp. SPB78]
MLRQPDRDPPAPGARLGRGGGAGDGPAVDPLPYVRLAGRTTGLGPAPVTRRPHVSRRARARHETPPEVGPSPRR